MITLSYRYYLKKQPFHPNIDVVGMTTSIVVGVISIDLMNIIVIEG